MGRNIEPDRTSNPGHDIHNLKADDVLAPARQAEIEAVTSALGEIPADQGRGGMDCDSLRIGSGTAQPGVNLLTAWYKRNFLICANLIQLSRPGDHIVVFYGSGHAFLLRQCVTEIPGFELAEPNDYLTK